MESLLQKVWKYPHSWLLDSSRLKGLLKPKLVSIPSLIYFHHIYMSFPSVMIGLGASHFLPPQHINNVLWFCGFLSLSGARLPQFCFVSFCFVCLCFLFLFFLLQEMYFGNEVLLWDRLISITLSLELKYEGFWSNNISLNLRQTLCRNRVSCMFGAKVDT